MKKYHTQRENLKTFFFLKFEGKVCLTSDIWPSLTHTGFLCITAHYIDSEWKLNKIIISFKTISFCDAPKPGGPLTTRQPVEILMNVG